MFERTITKNSLNNVTGYVNTMKAFSINTTIISPFNTDTDSYATFQHPQFHSLTIIGPICTEQTVLLCFGVSLFAMILTSSLLDIQTWMISDHALLFYTASCREPKVVPDSFIIMYTTHKIKCLICSSTLPHRIMCLKNRTFWLAAHCHKPINIDHCFQSSFINTLYFPVPL